MTPPTRLDLPALLAALTLPEKAALLEGSDFWHTTPVARLGIPAIMVADGPHGLRRQDEDADHLGLGASLPATCFPPAAGLASSWDVGLLRRVGEALGDEARAQGVSVLLGPGINMKRSPLCGRNFEYFSEDPRLAGDLAAAWVAGVQSRGVGTSLKHFAANNQETDRMTVSVEADERTLREIYLAAFERVVRAANPWTVMCSYNRINGVYASEDRWLLTEVLREDWGYDGLVVSDWGAVNDRPAGVHAGLDLEMPSSSGVSAQRIVAAVADGRLAEADVDLAVSRVLRLVDRALAARAAADAGTGGTGATAGSEAGDAAGRGFDADAHHALAREAAIAAAVLLRNDGGLLPLDAHAGGPIAVLGEFARTPRYQGAGSSQVNPTRLDDALTALRDAVGGAREVVFAPGYHLGADALGEADAALVAEAVAAARAAAVAVVFLGLPAAAESEGYDRQHLRLPDQQLELLAAVAGANPDVVVVLCNGSAVLVDWQGHARAVLECWLPGQAGGSAIADLLLGRAAPSGRLAETIPAREADTPTVGAFPGELGAVRYGEGLLIGYRWYDTRRIEPAYPFGHGLTYTSFAYSDVAAEVREDGPAPEVVVGVTVTNTGERAGTETVQVYVHDPVASVFRPDQELGGFARVTLAPGESRRVAVALDASAFSYWHPGAGRWVVEGGAFELRVGASSRDVRAVVGIEPAGEDVAPPLTAESTAAAWLAHPVGGPLLRAILDSPEGARMAHTLDDPVNGEMMRAVPLIRLARFPDSALNEDEIPGMVVRAAGG